MSAPIAIRVMIVDDHQGWGPSAMEKTGHLANGQIPHMADDSRRCIPYTGVERRPRQLKQRRPGCAFLSELSLLPTTGMSSWGV